MRNNTLFLSLLFIVCITGLSAKNVVINKPVCEFNSSGITNVARIEIRPTETRLHIHSTFLPNWWVRFSSSVYIEDVDTGERYTVTGMEKGELDKQIYMPASGDSTMILVFPPIDTKKVKKINFKKSDKEIVYGISLNPKDKPAPKGTIPAEVTQWIEQELKKAKQQTLVDLDSDAFFSREPARIVGYINGYSPKAGFSTGIVYAENDLTRENSPVVIQIHEDGRFEGEVPLIHPIYSYLVFQDRIVNFYIEPGQTLAMVIEWEEFRNADRYRDRDYTIHIDFSGVAGKVNKELADIERRLPDYAYGKLYNNFSLAPDKYVLLLDSVMHDRQAMIKEILDKEELLPHTRDILQVESLIRYYSYLFEYEMSYRNNRIRDGETEMEPLPTSFYDFLHKIPLNDQKLLIASSFDMFLNRFEYAGIFNNARSKVGENVQPSKAPFEYLLWLVKDSIYTHDLGLAPSLTYDIIKVRELKFDFEQLGKEEALDLLTKLILPLPNNFLKSEAVRLYNDQFAARSTGAYKLPPGKGTDVLRSIIDPFKGKYIFVDFWATTCGPCVGGIKQLKTEREKYKDSPDVAFVFITNDNESPLQAYEKFVAEQELTNVYRLKLDDFVYLRQLFKFNGIPHYVMVDREGRIMDDDFSMHGFEAALLDALEKER